MTVEERGADLRVKSMSEWFCLEWYQARPLGSSATAEHSKIGQTIRLGRRVPSVEATILIYKSLQIRERFTAVLKNDCGDILCQGEAIARYQDRTSKSP